MEYFNAVYQIWHASRLWVFGWLVLSLPFIIWAPLGLKIMGPLMFVPMGGFLVYVIGMLIKEGLDTWIKTHAEDC